MTNLTKRQKEMALVVLSVLLFIALAGYSFFQIYSPAKQGNDQVKASVANERDVLYALRKQQAGQSVSADNSGTQPMQRKVPVKPLEDAVLLQIEKGEVKSGGYVQDVKFSYGEYVLQQSPEHVENVNRLLTEVYLEAESYAEVRKFVEEIENMERVFIVEAIKVEVPEEKREQIGEEEPLKMTIAFNAFYRPDLLDLQDEAPKTDAPLPAGKDDPTPFNTGLETSGVQ